MAFELIMASGTFKGVVLNENDGDEDNEEETENQNGEVDDLEFHRIPCD